MEASTLLFFWLGNQPRRNFFRPNLEICQDHIFEHLQASDRELHGKIQEMVEGLGSRVTFFLEKIVGNNDTVDGAEIWLTTWEV